MKQAPKPLRIARLPATPENLARPNHGWVRTLPPEQQVICGGPATCKQCFGQWESLHKKKIQELKEVS